jgi:predicted secreted Zn-dependent protease
MRPPSLGARRGPASRASLAFASTLAAACAHVGVPVLPVDIAAAVPVDPGGAPLTWSIEADPYTVRGATPEAIRRSLSRRSPYVDDEGTTWDAGTRWKISWGYALVPEPSGCRIGSPKVHATVTVTAPVWVRRPNAEADATASWARFADALWAHERDHVVRALGAARQIFSTLTDASAAPAAPDCATANVDANRVASEVMTQMQGAQDAYDAETRHGRTQGAHFP